ncbi:hypothetical protein SAMD00019534_094710 [Acytostelium subglobosum LB1]|uniref:hypothetical protein n=1 Tax=Acytostelium subglobosum LB1 TaxID=1410327 RepID=UPI000645239E|nr:hypothetical protein SAMD00019534_094710 [Acytostelium subglobosum LB1]GAM26296.1 hypothetical protein SAMD00019534_094710 [Acytostelium subglobosum LB1]|eukprot:XP_012750850.1 hypothetical protein SAMD00019534_094710 [Acytostelium subglobosum LB1]
MLKYNATKHFIDAYNTVAHIYPFNCTLLASAAQYNNAIAFKHIYNVNDKVSMFRGSGNQLLPGICRHGSVDMLQLYLTATAHHPLPVRTIQFLPSVIDTNNVEFMRLLLENLATFGGYISFVHNDNAENKPRSQGISVAMLRLLHEEFNCLFTVDRLWIFVLMRCIQSNALDCVQYMIDHVPDPALIVEAEQQECRGLKDCMKQCGASGNIEIFELLSRSSIGVQLLNKIALREVTLRSIFTAAADHSQEAVIKQLCKLQDSNGVNLVENVEQMLSSFIDVGKDSLKLTTMAAIRKGDILGAESLISQHGVLDLDICREMSAEMATHLFRPRQTPLVFVEHSLIHLVRSVGKTGSSIIAEHVCMFLDNCGVQDPHSVNGAIKSAAGFSAAVMERIHTKLNCDYSEWCLMQAMRKECRESLAILLEFFADDLSESPSLRQCVYDVIATGQSMDIIKMVLNHMCKDDPKVCKWAVRHPSPEIFNQTINMFTMEQLRPCLIGIVEVALTMDKPQVLQILQQRLLDNNEVIVIRPNLETLKMVVDRNAYHSLEYIFNNLMDFNITSKLQWLRMIHSILDLAFEQGAVRAINICTERIKSLQAGAENNDSQVIKLTMDHIAADQVKPASQELETAFHLVFRDQKMGMMIMGQIGEIYASFGEEYSDRLIMGARLLEKDSLIDYIRYGATEWFLKAYTPISISSTYPYNEGILEDAFSKCDTRVLDVLLANPQMVIDNTKLTDEFVTNASSCSNPRWPLILDQYLSIICHNGAPLKVGGHQLAKIKQPAFLRRLLEIGAKLTPVEHSNICFQNVLDAWLDKPWALEMMQLMQEHALLAACHSSLFLLAIEHDIMPIVEYYIANQITLFDHLPSSRDIIHHCCQYGRLEIFNLLLQSYIPTMDFDPNDSWKQEFTSAARNGRLDMFVRMNGLLSPSPLHRTYQSAALDAALEHGNMSVVDFILDELASLPPVADPAQSTYISYIHYSILTQRLLERLMAHQHIVLKLDRITMECIHNDRIDTILDGQPLTLDYSDDDVGASIQPQADDDDASKVCTSVEFTRRIRNKINQGDIEALDKLIEQAKDTKFDLDDIIPMEISNLSVLSHLMDTLDYLNVDDQSNALVRLVDWACSMGHLDIVRHIHQQCKTTKQLQRHLPSTHYIIDAVSNNHHKVISYLFELDNDNISPPFKRVVLDNDSKSIIRLLNAMRHAACFDGHIKIINMCDRLLGSLQTKR